MKEKVAEETGSETPPHAWGRLYVHILTGALTRNTPTRVGKTISPKR